MSNRHHHGHRPEGGKGGMTAVEYGLIAALIAVLITTVISTVGGSLNERLTGTQVEQTDQ